MVGSGDVRAIDLEALEALVEHLAQAPADAWRD
jgi:hypothetical protein